MQNVLNYKDLLNRSKLVIHMPHYIKHTNIPNTCDNRKIPCIALVFVKNQIREKT